jgi:Amidohydrolase family
MRRSATTLTLCAIFAAACTTLHTGAPPAAHGVEYRNGQWFDGSTFVARTMFVADGVLRSTAPVHIDSVVDLANGYVVPPFADAHQHLVDPRIALTIAAQLHDGIYYVKDQSNAPIGRRMFGTALNTPMSFDYISANQGWTSPGGHPVEVVRRAGAMGGPMAVFARDSLDPGLVMQVDSREDVDRRWAYFLAGQPRPDFVKVFLLRSEDYARLRQDPKAVGNRGIDPALVPYIVSLAHKAGLQVSAHVFTAADFRVAVNAGVDQMAHLPGGRSANPAPFLLADSDAAAAAAHGVTVITTITQHGDSAITDRLVKEQYTNNITLLRAHGVPLLLGSDAIGGTAVPEAAALARSGLFTNAELLRMWSMTTPRAIYPNRRIGALDDGFEASFLVLAGNPLTDFRNTRAITMRVKQGVTLAIR